MLLLAYTFSVSVDPATVQILRIVVGCVLVLIAAFLAFSISFGSDSGLLGCCGVFVGIILLLLVVAAVVAFAVGWIP